MVDLPRVRTPGQLQDGLDQLVLEWVEVPVRHALAAVAYVQRQQVARLDLVADPPTGFARHLGKRRDGKVVRSEEHTSELQSLMRISYAVFCLKKKKHTYITHTQES